jgi:tyrosinase
MENSTNLKVRSSLEELQNEYNNGNKKPLEDLMRAWAGIKELPANDPHSFFMLGGYHGEPFRGAGWGNNAYWGGYCNHGNVLFPTWHRIYLVKLEEALQSIAGCEDVMLPYWDETCEESLTKGIPWALTVENFDLDGTTIPNPLRSFVFNKTITDNIQNDDPNYTKPIGYETVRYPLSGLVGSPTDRQATAAHNAQFPDYDTNVSLLNQNIINWLGSSVMVNGKPIPTNVAQKFKDCLNAPNYTVFSNTTSAQEWNNNLDANSGEQKVTPLESPHNSIHLAVGGFDVPSLPDQPDFSPISGANGDMGENDTAGLDPIFYFHHCNIDRMFWLWQKKNGHTDSLEIIAEYPGTNTVDNQGPTPGMAPNSWLTLETPLNPFKKTGDIAEETYTSLDAVNIEKQLGYTYSVGSLDGMPVQTLMQAVGGSSKMIRVTKINKAPIRGSFLVSAFAIIDGQRHHIGTEAVLSRWSIKYCANCQTHVEVKAFFGLEGFEEERLADAHYEIEIKGRDGILTNNRSNEMLMAQKSLFKMEVR